MLVLGIDPGTARIGYGLVKKNGSKYQPVDYGLLELDKDVPHSKRLSAIFDKIQILIDDFKPDLFSVEELFFFKNVTTAISVAEARGVIVLAAEKKGLPIFEPTPLQVKQGITGYGRADKDQIARMVKLLLGLKEIPKPDDITDALAIAITGANYYPGYNKT